jgi:tRNA A-37 threonylcarbamoyl transferase component Bud32
MEEAKPFKQELPVDETEESKPSVIVSPGQSDTATTLTVGKQTPTSEKTEPAATMADDPLPGTLLGGRYQIFSLIGKGATSSVYKAMDTSLEHSVAVKVLHSHLTSDEVIVRRFKQEVRTASLIAHPNVVAIHDCSESPGGQPYFVMDYVDGVSLQQLMQQLGWLPVDRAIAIFSQVCAALAAAHEKGIVHRDLKPSNIMVTKTDAGQDLVKVLDFGVAKILPMQGETFQRLTQTGEMLGSLLYMSPEQCLDQDVDGRSDIYSLGCVLYEAVTGKPPLCGRTAFETMNKHMSDTPERLDKVRPELHFPPALERVIFKAMAKQPQNRHQNSSEFLDDLQKLPATGGTFIQQPDLIAAPGTNLVPDLSVAAVAQKELDRENDQCLALTTCAVGLFVAMIVLPICLFLFGYPIDWIICLAFEILMGLAPLLVLVGARYEAKKVTIPRVTRAVSVVSRVKPTNVFVSRVKWVVGIESAAKYRIDVSAASGTNLSPTRLMIQLACAKNEDYEFWKALCAASELADIGQSGVFPVPCNIYIDPETQEPVVVTIKGHLTWVVS